MRGVISRPGAHDVADYRSNVDDRMRDLLDRVDDGTFTKLAPIVELGFHHEQQHQELLLMDIKHVLSRSEEHTSELQSLMRISYAVFCLNKKTHERNQKHDQRHR